MARLPRTAAVLGCTLIALASGPGTAQAAAPPAAAAAVRAGQGPSTTVPGGPSDTTPETCTGWWIFVHCS